MVYIVYYASSPASKVQKTPAKLSYSLIGDLHGMQGVRGSNPLGSITFLASFTYIFKFMILIFQYIFKIKNYNYVKNY